MKVAFFAYGIACHAMFLAVYAWMAAFVGGFIPNFPLPILDGQSTGSLGMVPAIKGTALARGLLSLAIPDL